MSIWQPGDEDTLSFETEDRHDPNNTYFTLDEDSPEQALWLRIGTTKTALAADEALTLLDWLQEREGVLFELCKRQAIVAPTHGDGKAHEEQHTPDS